MKIAPALTSLVALAALAGGCAQQGGAPEPMADRRTLDCPAGHTRTCEINRIGRIRHGTFAHDAEKCSCVPDGSRQLESPRIPTIRQ